MKLNNLQDYIIFCDFDGTISVIDTINTLFDDFASKKWLEIEEIWEQGLIGSKECMERQLDCIPAISQSQLDDFIDGMNIDSEFKAFIEAVQENNIDFHIVSDGFSLIIGKVLAKNKIFGVNIIASDVNLVENKLVPKFPNEDCDCLVKAGNCKCKAIERFSSNKKVIYIGDGYSDTCAIRKADYIFAKKKLAEYCEKNAIEYTRFEDFKKIKEILFVTKENYVSC